MHGKDWEPGLPACYQGPAQGMGGSCTPTGYTLTPCMAGSLAGLHQQSGKVFHDRNTGIINFR